ncbi:type IV secretion protein Rhs, partial [filamentous cyanobacterium CCP5]
MVKLRDAFISYGRADSKSFAVDLYHRLAELGWEIWFDFEDIPLGVDFQAQINEGIATSDNFLFIVSPASVNSPYCLREIDRALAFNKRIIPIVHVTETSRQVWQARFPSGTDADWAAYQAAGRHSYSANMHPELRKLNWLNFRVGVDSFEQSLADLVNLFESHKTYVHRHTHLLVQALEWERQHRESRYLLIAEERQQAEVWLRQKFGGEQPPCLPTDLHCEFITESKKNANNMMSEVFLAYAEEDTAMMEKIRRSLRREGFSVWTSSTDIQTGSDFQQAIEQGIESADNLVYLLSPDALNSSYCQHELDYALSLYKRIIPLRVREVEADQAPQILQDLQYIDLADNLTEADYLAAESQLVKVLRQEATYFEEHKLWLVKAFKWDRQYRNPALLLRGFNLRRAEAWLKTAQQQSQHPPTALQQAFIAESLRQPPVGSLDVFISYSRADSDFARQLNDALQVQQKLTWFDQESIPPGVDFQQAIADGIENSDYFLFVISPSSVQSPYCASEVEYAQTLNKRIVTVLHRPVDPTDLHPVLATVQWIDFNRYSGQFAANFQELIRTLDTDPVHLRAHTRLLVKAIEWHSRGRQDSLLLRGEDLEAAETWLGNGISKEPRPTELQVDYIRNSRIAEEAHQKEIIRTLQAAQLEAQRRIRTGSFFMVIMPVIGAVLGLWIYDVLSGGVIAASLPDLPLIRWVPHPRNNGEPTAIARAPARPFLSGGHSSGRNLASVLPDP